MLVRFNKGPWHRRVQHIEDHVAQQGAITVAVYDKKAMQPLRIDNGLGSHVMVAPSHKIATYRIKMVTVNLRGTPEQLPSVYPDGAVCFEYIGSV